LDSQYWYIISNRLEPSLKFNQIWFEICIVELMCAVLYADPSLSWRTDKYHQWVTQKVDQLPQNHSAADFPEM